MKTKLSRGGYKDLKLTTFQMSECTTNELNYDWHLSEVSFADSAISFNGNDTLSGLRSAVCKLVQGGDPCDLCTRSKSCVNESECMKNNFKDFEYNDDWNN